MRTALLAALLLTAPAAAQTFTHPAARADIQAKLEALTHPDALDNFAGLSEKGQRGFRHIVEGRALPSPLPVGIGAVLATARDRVGRWLNEGSLPNPLAPDVGVGEAAYTDAAGLTVSTKTCFHCHAGVAGGRLVAGLASTHIDTTASLAILKHRAPQLDRYEAWLGLGDGEPPDGFPRVPAAQREATLRALVDFRVHSADVIAPAFQYAAARGENLGPYSVWAHAARFADPHETGILISPAGSPANAPYEALLTARPLPPVDPLPWWTIKFRDHAYWFHDAPGHSAAAFNLNFYVLERDVDRPELFDAHRAKVAVRERMIDEVLAYARDRAAGAPRPQQRLLLANRDAIERGARLFHGQAGSRKQQCASCHGTYAFTADALEVACPDRGPLDVGTDPEYSAALRRFAPLAERITAAGAAYGPGGPFSIPVTKAGYVAPPLVGIWASAPYLHNGSVPTLADLLEERRPQIWARRVDDPTAYDYEKVGLDHEVVDAATHAARLAAANGRDVRSPAAIEARRDCDTRVTGRSNAGHRYGTELTRAEKDDLLAFLKALSPLRGGRGS